MAIAARSSITGRATSAVLVLAVLLIAPVVASGAADRPGAATLAVRRPRRPHARAIACRTCAWRRIARPAPRAAVERAAPPPLHHPHRQRAASGRSCSTAPRASTGATSMTVSPAREDARPGSARSPTTAVMRYSGDGHTHWHTQRVAAYELLAKLDPAMVRR